MDAFEINDNIILKGTNFTSKPLFTAFNEAEFDTIATNLMTRYGKSITNGRPIKGKERLIYENENGYGSFLKWIPIPLQPFYKPFFKSVLLVVGSDNSKNIVLTSPIKRKVWKVFSSSQYPLKKFSARVLPEIVERFEMFTALNYDANQTKLEEGWHKTVKIRKRKKVKLYIVPKPLEYFPILFIGCSQHNIKHMYDNITSLLRASNEPRLYTPYAFNEALLRPLVFNIAGDRLLYRQRLPNVDVTDEEYFYLREEFLYDMRRYLVSDCRCRSNTELIPKDPPALEYSWVWADMYFNRYNCYFPVGNIYRSSYNAQFRGLPMYSQTQSECNCQSDLKDTEGNALGKISSNKNPRSLKGNSNTQLPV
ncbi:hypothetical protein, no similarity [Maudiozyma saulgeensis]|uniref:Uncharacterized protein n=1 Tax=Maudiozyma saulgeensis TaxID=1789683 RepID=A0A1X7RAX7_9SACH|nr:hypothetical protein, no similarity [Kazachstania saulgeensis]